MTNKDNIITELVETGSDISGSVAGAVIGGLVAGPSGAIIGGASGPFLTRIFKKVGTEIKNRFISPREEVRIGAVYGFAINKIQQNIKDGQTIRNDSFFENRESKRADSEEIFEGVILGAQKEYEERKVKYLGNLYGNICTNDKIIREHANQLIKITNNLSYRQLCILQLFVEKWNENHNFKFRVKLDIPKIETSDIIIEIRDLQQRGLINIISRWKDIDDNSKPIETDDINLTETGLFYSEMLSLNEIPLEELKKLNSLLKIID